MTTAKEFATKVAADLAGTMILRRELGQTNWDDRLAALQRRRDPDGIEKGAMHKQSLGMQDLQGAGSKALEYLGAPGHEALEYGLAGAGLGGLLGGASSFARPKEERHPFRSAISGAMAGAAIGGGGRYAYDHMKNYTDNMPGAGATGAAPGMGGVPGKPIPPTPDVVRAAGGDPSKMTIQQQIDLLHQVNQANAANAPTPIHNSIVGGAVGATAGGAAGQSVGALSRGAKSRLGPGGLKDMAPPVELGKVPDNGAASSVTVNQGSPGGGVKIPVNNADPLKSRMSEQGRDYAQEGSALHDIRPGRIGWGKQLRAVGKSLGSGFGQGEEINPVLDNGLTNRQTLSTFGEGMGKISPTGIAGSIGGGLVGAAIPWLLQHGDGGGASTGIPAASPPPVGAY